MLMVKLAWFTCSKGAQERVRSVPGCQDNDTAQQQLLAAIGSDLSELLATTRDIEANRQANDKQDASTDSIRKDMMEMNVRLTGRIHTLDLSVAGINEQLKAIRAMQERIERNIERMANGRAKELGIETDQNGA